MPITYSHTRHGRWLKGPYCSLCNVSDGSRYYNSELSECVLCDTDNAEKAAAYVGGFLAVLSAAILLVWFRPDRKIKCLVRLYLRLGSLYTQVSLRAKYTDGDSNPGVGNGRLADAVSPFVCPLAGSSNAWASIRSCSCTRHALDQPYPYPCPNSYPTPTLTHPYPYSYSCPPSHPTTNLT